MFNLNDDIRLFPQITFRVNTIRIHDILSWPQPDGNLNNIINNLKSQTVWVPNVPYPLKHGDVFSLYGKKAVILYNEYRQINATSNLSITLDLLYYGPPIPESTTSSTSTTTSTTTPEPTTTSTTTPEPTTTSTTTPEPTTTSTTTTSTTTTPEPTTTSTTTPEPTTTSTTTTPEPTTTSTTTTPEPTTTSTTTPEPTTTSTTTTPEPTTTSTTTPEPTTTSTTTPEPTSTSTTTTPEPTTTSTTTPEPTTTSTTTTSTTTPEPTTTSTTTPEPTTTSTTTTSTTTPEPTTTSTSTSTTTSTTTSTSTSTSTTTSTSTSTTTSTTTTAAPNPNTPALQIWYDAADSGFVNSYGGSVTQWSDKQTANPAHNANAAGNPTKPTSVLSVQNSKAIIRFNGTSNTLSANPITQLASQVHASIIVVCKTTNAAATQQITMAGTNTTNLNGYALGTGSNLFNIKFAGGVANSDKATDTNYNIHTLIYDGTQSTNATKLVYRINGVQKTLTFSVNVNSSTNASITHMYFGSDAGPANYFVGDICEVLIYTATLSASEIQNTEGYLSSKWNIALG